MGVEWSSDSKSRVGWSSNLGVGWNLEQQKCEMGCPLTDAETALLTSIKALKNDSFAQRSFFLRLSFHDELPLNLRNKKIVHCS